MAGIAANVETGEMFLSKESASRLGIALLGALLGCNVFAVPFANGLDPMGYMMEKWGMTPEQVKATWSGAPLTFHSLQYVNDASQDYTAADADITIAGYSGQIRMKFGCHSQLREVSINLRGAPADEIAGMYRAKHGEESDKSSYGAPKVYIWQYPGTRVWIEDDQILYTSMASAPVSEGSRADARACAARAAENVDAL